MWVTGRKAVGAEAADGAESGFDGEREGFAEWAARRGGGGEEEEEEEEESVADGTVGRRVRRG